MHHLISYLTVLIMQNNSTVTSGNYLGLKKSLYRASDQKKG